MRTRFAATTGASDGGGKAEPPVWLRCVNVLSFAGALVANGTAGSRVGKVSHKYDNDIVPDGWAFSIWALIYTGLTGFCIYQVILPTACSKAAVGRIGPLWVASNALNALWIVVWVQGTPLCAALSTVVLFALLGVNIAIMWNSGAWDPYSGFNWWDKLCIYLPFSIYCAWTTVAAVVASAATLVAPGWDGSPLSPAVWSATMLSVAALINLVVLYTRRDPVYALVFCWAAAAIYTGHHDDNVVSTAALLCLVVVACADAVCIGILLRQRDQSGSNANAGLYSSLESTERR